MNYFNGKLVSAFLTILVLVIGGNKAMGQTENKFWSGIVLATGYADHTYYDVGHNYDGRYGKDSPDNAPDDDILNDSLSFAVSDRAGGEIVTWLRQVTFKNPDTSASPVELEFSKVHVQMIDHEGVPKFVWETSSNNDINGGMFATDWQHQSDQYAPLVATDEDGGYYVIWKEHPVWTTQNFLYAQHVNSSGTRMYSDTGINLTPNGLNMDHANILGYWITATDDNRAMVVVGVESPDLANGDIWAFMLGTSDSLWSKRVTNAATCFNPYVEHDHDGGGFVAWNDVRGGNIDVYGEHVFSDGTIAWDSVTLLGKPIANTSDSESISDFNITVATFSLDPVYVYRVDSAGSHLYRAMSLTRGLGNPVSGWPMYLSGNRVSARAISEINGGIFIATATETSAGYGLNNIGNAVKVAFIQAGSPPTMGWSGTETTVSDGSGSAEYVNPYIIHDGYTGSIVAWQRNLANNVSDPYSSVRAQRLNTSGAIQWGSGDVTAFQEYKILNSEDPSIYCAMPAEDGSHGAFVSWGMQQIIDTALTTTTDSLIDGTTWQIKYESHTLATYHEFAQPIYTQRLNDSTAGYPSFVNVEIFAGHSTSDIPVVTVPCKDSSLWIVWMHQSLLDSTKHEVRIQHLDEYGIRMLNDQGDTVPGSQNAVLTYASKYESPGPGYHVLDAVSDDSTGLVIIWSGLNAVSEPDVCISHILQNDVALWNDGAGDPFYEMTSLGVGFGRIQPRITRSRDTTVSPKMTYYPISWVEKTVSTSYSAGAYYKIMGQLLYDDPTLGTKCHENFTPYLSLTKDTCLTDNPLYVLNPQICPDLYGGAWVAWWDGTSAPSPTASVVARHFGQHPFGEADKFICFLRPSATTTSPIYSHQICADSTMGTVFTVSPPRYSPSGCYIAFVGHDTSGSSGDDIYLAHANVEHNSQRRFCGPGGVFSYKTDFGVHVVTTGSGDDEDPRLSFTTVAGYPAAREVFVSWDNLGNGGTTSGIYSQRCNVDAFTGSLGSVWVPNSGGIETDGSASFVNGRVFTDPNESAVFAWQRSAGTVGGTSVFDMNASKYDNSGSTALWSPSIMPLSDYPRSPGKQFGNMTDMVRVGSCSIASAWSEPRFAHSVPDFANFVFAQKLHGEDGTFAKRMAGNSALQPLTTALLQNYPNPFTVGTDILYSISNDDHVRVVLQDLVGRTLAVLVDEDQASGTHQLHVNCTGLQTGMYLYALQTSQQLLHGKMTIIR